MYDYISEIVRDDIRVTLETDRDALNPVDHFDWRGIHFQPHDSRRIDSGDTDLPRALEGWFDDHENMAWDVEEFSRQLSTANNKLQELRSAALVSPDDIEAQVAEVEETAAALADAVDTLEDHLSNRSDVQQEDFGDMVVTYSPSALAEHFGTPEGGISELVESLKSDYDQWCDGDVFIMSAWEWDYELGDWSEMMETYTDVHGSRFNLPMSLAGCYFRNWCDDDEVWQHASDSFGFASRPVQEKLF